MISHHRKLAAGLFLAAGLVGLVYCGQARSHEWYDFSCCQKHDCRPTTIGEVTRHADGWYIVPTGELIPFSGDPRLKQSMDPLMHRCLYTYAMPTISKRIGDTRCLYVATPGG